MLKKPSTSQKTALISVSDKTGIIPFARALRRLGFTLLSTGGTAAHLRDNKIPVTDIADITHFPEILDGRVKTLHPMIFGGILARATPSHAQELTHHSIPRIDLICVNLYPFAATIANEKTTLAQAIEKIDIGGVSLLRAGAKNHENVIVLCSPTQYADTLKHLSTNTVDQSHRLALAAAAFAHTSHYDAAIATYLSGGTHLGLSYTQAGQLRYGENPHQVASLYTAPHEQNGIVQAQVLQGKALSYNNLVDAEVAQNIVADFTSPTAAIIKHACPCGVATASTIEAALASALAADTISPFGGIIAVNRPLTLAAAKLLQPLFLELIIAPSILPAARRLLATKKNLRLLEVGNHYTPSQTELRKISGGLLIQARDNSIIQKSHLKTVTKKSPKPQQIADLIFGANVCKHVKSNAIVIVKNQVAIGIGAGQTSRVDAVNIALKKAGAAAKGAILASDAFFPFADGILAAHDAGISAIIQPGGSIRDAEVIEAANVANIPMVFTGVRAFKH